LDREIRDRGRGGDPLFSLFLDAAGVALLEALGAVCQERIKSVVKPMGLFCGCPFGPGYGTSPMGSFADLLQHVDGEAVGVRLAGDVMMEPLKSVAFWLRLTADNESIKSQGYKCRRCTMENCIYRAAPYDA
jgi:cobalamin-dependent methionine synthase I